MWRPEYEAYPAHREVVSWYRDGKPSTWSEPPYLWPKFVDVTNHLLDHCPPPAYLLDVGCFTGYFLRHLAALGYRGVGVDLQAELMGALHEMVRYGSPLDFRFCSAESVADLYPEGTFDAVVALDVLEHVLDVDRALSAMDRVLRPGGTWIVHLPREDRDSAEHLRSYAELADVQAVGARWRDCTVHSGLDEWGRRTWLVVGTK